MMTQALDTIALSDAIGAEIRDIDLAHIDGAAFTAIDDVWLRFQDLVMWNNGCSMHRRDAFDSKDRRIMHRTQIKGRALIADDRQSKTRRSTASL